MTATMILGLLLQASLFLVVLSFGLQIRVDDLLCLFRRPWQLLKSLISMFVVLLIFAIVVDRIFELRGVVEVALIALALSPVPPLLPNKALKSGGDKSFTFGLLAAVSLLSIIIMPGVFRVVEAIFGRQGNFSEEVVLKAILTGVVMPVVIGMIIRHLAPASERFAGILGKVGMVILILACLPILVALSSVIWTIIGNGPILAIIAFAVVGIIAGHLLGGPDPRDRTVLAIATASRHPAIAIAVTSANVGEADAKLAAAVVILYVIASSVVLAVYLRLIARLRDVNEEKNT